MIQGNGTVVVVRSGSGPEVLLVHGGAGPTSTWRGLEPLRDRWTLAAMYRRGFPPSPPPTTGRGDFADDADDLAGLLGTRPHLVAHSYGGIGAMLATARAPHRVRSLTLLEPAVQLVQDRGTEHLRRLAETVLARGPATDPAALREFLTVAGSPVPDDDGPLPAHVLAAVHRAHGVRSPYEADLPLGPLRDAAVPVLVASGGHYDALERNMDALAAELDATRLVAPGAGHFVPAADGFADQLDGFLASVP